MGFIQWGVRVLRVFLVVFFLPLHPSEAGVFNLPHLVAPGEFAIGIEPEILFGTGAALGANVKYMHGVSDSSNFTGTLGTGGGSRQFRAGGAFTFDFFPDLEKQPGIGLALQGLFVQVQGVGAVEVTGIPYIHKTLRLRAGDIEPFLAVPLGLYLSQGAYQPLITVTMGSFFFHNEHLRSVVELGVALQNSSTYVSGGIIYYH